MKRSDELRIELGKVQARYIQLRRENDVDKKRDKELEKEINELQGTINRLGDSRRQLQQRIVDRESNELGTAHIVRLMDKIALLEGDD